MYCEYKWFYLNNPKLKRVPSNSSTQNRKYVSRIAGQANEALCVDWILNAYQLESDAIIYNGTGNNTKEFITSFMDHVNIKINCKPDLIIKEGDKNILFEFKALSDESYILFEPFDSVYAQIWCYTKLEGIKIDEYRLLRYFINPNKSPFKTITSLTKKELDDNKFETLFEKYMNAVQVVNALADSNNTSIRNKVCAVK